MGVVGADTMRETAAPLVPEMPTESETTPDPAVTSDGGERRALPERTYGVPIVPDCS